MKAIRIHQFGPTEEVLQYEEVPTPAAGPGELLVKVEAASLNRADLHLRKGTYRVDPKELPMIPGREFAGTVAAVGANVSDFKLGQRVVAHPAKGGYAEYAVTKALWARPVPDGVELAVAAAIPTVFLTAWFALIEDGKIKSGDQVLVQAGGSGVGTAAIQIARHLGARVIATAGTDEKCQRLLGLGADSAVNYSAKDFRQEVQHLTAGRGVDIVLEMIGGEVYSRSIDALAAGGRLVSIGGAVGPIPDPPPTLTEGRKATRFSITNYLNARPEAFKQMDFFLDMVRQKKFQLVIDRAFPLAETRAAQRYLEGRAHFGKIVLTM